MESLTCVLLNANKVSKRTGLSDVMLLLGDTTDGDTFFSSGVRAGIRVFTLVTRGWAASKFLMRASKFNMTPNGECQIIGPDRSHIFDAGMNF